VTTTTETLQVHSKKSYFIVFALLAVLTAIELAIPYLGIPKMTGAMALVLLAFSKASAVALYYMHLKFETMYLKFIAMLPLITAMYAIVLMLEAIAR